MSERYRVWEGWHRPNQTRETPSCSSPCTINDRATQQTTITFECRFRGVPAGWVCRGTAPRLPFSDICCTAASGRAVCRGVITELIFSEEGGGRSPLAGNSADYTEPAAPVGMPRWTTVRPTRAPHPAPPQPLLGDALRSPAPGKHRSPWNSPVPPAEPRAPTPRERGRPHLGHVVVPALPLLLLQLNGDTPDGAPLDALHQVGDIPAGQAA